MLKFAGRDTRMGAYTTVRKVQGNVKIIETNYSKTGNHWDIFVSGTGIIDIIDISNSGKHRCKRVRIENSEIKETILAPKWSYWDICPICRKLKKRHKEGLVSNIFLFLLCYARVSLRNTIFLH